MVFTAEFFDGYFADIDSLGLELTWDKILDSYSSGDAADANGHDDYRDIPIEYFGELYEHGLAHENKISKKELGKYYTPMDVASVMSEWLVNLDGENIVDVSCGTGNLILSFLDTIGREATAELISGGKIWLYDFDAVALKICERSILALYGDGCDNNIHTVCGDFLNNNIHLPCDCKVISNPPYSRITCYGSDWNVTENIEQCRDLYGAFMEKIVSESSSSVIISPYSFIGGSKFSKLRDILLTKTGEIYSFDNMPSAIFNGQKKGIFNTNTSNSVRAAITVSYKSDNCSGYKVTPLIRFSSNERDRLLDTAVLESFLSESRINENGKHGFPKCEKELVEVLRAWKAKSDETLGNYLKSTSDNPKDIRIDIPTTCRYYLSGTKISLSRSGKRTYYVNGEDNYKIIYAFINSSFCYWHWRLYDGGVTYADNLLKDMPVFVRKILSDDENMSLLEQTVDKMISAETSYLVYKKNAGIMQENVKFPNTYRKELNKVLLKTLGFDEDTEELFEKIHTPRIFSNAVS